MDNTTREELYRAINALETRGDCVEISDMLHARYKYIEVGLKHQFRVGDKVSFVGKYGIVEHGEIAKMGRGQTITVKTNSTLWSVSLSVLTKEE